MGIHRYADCPLPLRLHRPRPLLSLTVRTRTTTTTQCMAIQSAQECSRFMGTSLPIRRVAHFESARHSLRLRALLQRILLSGTFFDLWRALSSVSRVPEWVHQHLHRCVLRWRNELASSLYVRTDMRTLLPIQQLATAKQILWRLYGASDSLGNHTGCGNGRRCPGHAIFYRRWAVVLMPGISRGSVGHRAHGQPIKFGNLWPAFLPHQQRHNLSRG